MQLTHPHCFLVFLRIIEQQLKIFINLRRFYPKHTFPLSFMLQLHLHFFYYSSACVYLNADLIHKVSYHQQFLVFLFFLQKMIYADINALLFLNNFYLVPCYLNAVYLRINARINALQFLLLHCHTNDSFNIITRHMVVTGRCAIQVAPKAIQIVAKILI